MPSSSVVLSLSFQVLVFLLRKIELYHHESLKALPTMLRKKLLKYLPLADILLLERQEVTHDLNMNEIWKDLLLERLEKVIGSSKALQRQIDAYDGSSWRNLYLGILWDADQMGKSNAGYNLDPDPSSSIITAHGGRNVIEVDCNNYDTVLFNSLFGVDVNTVSACNPSSLHEMYYVFCHQCQTDIVIIPKRFLIHYVHRSNKNLFLYFLSIFWTYGRYRPKRVTLSKKETRTDMRHDGLVTKIIRKYPKLLSVPMEKVTMLQFIPIYTSNTEFHLIKFLLVCISKSLQSMTLVVKPDYPAGRMIPIEIFPTNIQELTVNGGNNQQSIVQDFLECVVSLYSNKLKKLSFDAFPLSCYTNEMFIMTICGLFSKRKFKKLSLCDAELSVEIMNNLIEALLSSKYEQELELTSMRMLQFTDTASMLSVGRQAVNTRQKSLTLNDMVKRGFGDTCQHVFDGLRALPLQRLTITVDMAEMLKVCDIVPARELVLKFDTVQSESAKYIKDVLVKPGYESVTIEIPLSDWIHHIHFMGRSPTKMLAAETLFNTVVSVVEVAATNGKLKKLTFYSKSDDYKILGSSNPLSLPEGTVSLIFTKIFSLPNLHRLTIDLSRFNMTVAFVGCIVKAWSTTAKGRRVASVVMTITNDLRPTRGDLEVICEVLDG